MTTQTKCPFADYDCDRPNCDGCAIRIEAIAKENEVIADNMRGLWVCQRSHADK